MRLKTKLVLAITALVLLISGLLSLVYVSQFAGLGKGHYATKKMVANSAAWSRMFRNWPEGLQFDPKNLYEL
jgi:hypothetical protein